MTPVENSRADYPALVHFREDFEIGETIAVLGGVRG
jgi:hypothetical protein